MTKRIVLLQALASTPGDITRLARGLGEAPDWRPEPEAWSGRDVLSHLVLVERASLARLNRVFAEDVPAIAAIYPDPAAHDHHALPTALAETFRLARETTLSTLQNLPPGAWQRPATHETRGRVTARYLVHMLVTHDIEHTNQLVEIMQAWRAAQKIAAGPK
jgi:hypothetical protein